MLNKNSKTWINYMAGAIISVLLVWGIYSQVRGQLAGLPPDAWLQTGPQVFLWLCIGLLFVNTSLEGYKWYRLVGVVQPVTYGRAMASYFAGVAFSIVTPNRVGEYPGRILYLGGGNTFGYINAAIMGVITQLSAVYIFGMGALVFYNIAFPSPLAASALVFCVICNAGLFVVRRSYDRWLPLLERIRPLRRFAVYSRMIGRMDNKIKREMLAISLLRFSIFTAQYLFLLRWMHVDIPLAAGFCMCALFFWVMAVIPTIALTELGIRGMVSIYLFNHYAHNDVGMVTATVAMWLINLAIPAISGSILMLGMKIVR